MRTRFAVVVGLGLLAAAVPARAHHSFAAEFDSSKPVKVTGTVTKIEWANPHVWFYIDVKDEAGKVTNWAMEMGGPNGLLRAGWIRNSMKPRDVVRVDGFQPRTGKRIGNATTEIVDSTGQAVFAASRRGQ